MKKKRKIESVFNYSEEAVSSDGDASNVESQHNAVNEQEQKKKVRQERNNFQGLNSSQTKEVDAQSISISPISSSLSTLKQSQAAASLNPPGIKSKWDAIQQSYGEEDDYEDEEMVASKKSRDPSNEYDNLVSLDDLESLNLDFFDNDACDDFDAYINDNIVESEQGEDDDSSYSEAELLSANITRDPSNERLNTACKTVEATDQPPQIQSLLSAGVTNASNLRKNPFAGRRVNRKPLENERASANFDNESRVSSIWSSMFAGKLAAANDQVEVAETEVKDKNIF